MTSQAVLDALSGLLAKPFQGLPLEAEDLQFLMHQSGPEAWDAIFDASRKLHRKHFGSRIVLYAPLYFSSFCVNECCYCGFKVSNRNLVRKTLTQEEFVLEARHLWDAGHRTLVLIAGEDPRHTRAGQIAEYLKTLRREAMDFFVILEAGPLETGEYRHLKELGVRQCLMYQETYAPSLYETLHRGPKRDYAWRRGALDRAVEAGISRIGIGILLGLRDWREDFLDLVSHAREFQAKFGIDPASVSLPRLRPAAGLDWEGPKFEIGDEDFKKMIALARLALPSSGINLTTREPARLRDEILKGGCGVSQVSAGCSTVPGGYAVNPERLDGQFYLQDTRSLREVEERLLQLGYRAAVRPEEGAL